MELKYYNNASSFKKLVKQSYYINIICIFIIYIDINHTIHLLVVFNKNFKYKSYKRFHKYEIFIIIFNNDNQNDLNIICIVHIQ